ncbi:hypothetical protein [Dehalobacter sp. TBBPA1]|uniref:hypothetical protein n=1 Tax=Dehalobacter sp. TBBPA1 TaxID=3235037 RepID=UPI0034A2DC08
MYIFLLIAAFVIIVLRETPSLVSRKQWRELIVFSAFSIIAFTLTFLQLIHVKFPDIYQGAEVLKKIPAIHSFLQ